jgi:NitT/TauT family transport system substrate-binding protein
MSRIRPLIVIACLAGLAACGGSDSGTSGGQAQTTGGVTQLKIATQPIVDSAPLYLGVSKGFFTEQGIELTIDTAVGGAAVIPGVVSGSLDFGRGNLLSTMVANDKGLDMRCITNANSTAGKPDIGAVVVRRDSPIANAAQLSGRSVSVNTVNNIGDTTIRTVVQDAGGDPQAVRFVEIPFPDAPAALERGQVDAAWILEPFLTQATDQGAKVISYNFSEFHPQLDISCVFTTQRYIQEKGDIVNRFRNAMNKSLQYSDQHPDEVRAIVGTYTKIEPSILQRMVIPKFRAEFSKEATVKLGQKGKEFGTLAKEPDINTFFSSPTFLPSS